MKTLLPIIGAVLLASNAHAESAPRAPSPNAVLLQRRLTSEQLDKAAQLCAFHLDTFSRPEWGWEVCKEVYEAWLDAEWKRRQAKEETDLETRRNEVLAHDPDRQKLKDIVGQ